MIRRPKEPKSRETQAERYWRSYVDDGEFGPGAAVVIMAVLLAASLILPKHDLGEVSNAAPATGEHVLLTDTAARATFWNRGA